MIGTGRLYSPLSFSEILYDCMIPINAGIKKLALYEFCYAIENLYPRDGWESIKLEDQGEIERMISQRAFYESIQVKPRLKDRIVLDENITRLTRMLFAGLVRGEYNQEWVNKFFYFDIRGFYFLPRTIYFTEAGKEHFGGKPFLSFEPLQKQFEEVQDIGYLDFQEANREIDQAFIKILKTLIEIQGTPILISLAGPTAAGKTEITEHLLNIFEQKGKKITTIEMDNFLYDRDLRGSKAMGVETTHFKLFKRGLQDILQGKKITIPRYDSTTASSSHDLEGNLKPGCLPLEIEPADIIILEGNFPFQMDEIADLIAFKIVYLTDDPVRLKRKWKRDIDYRKNYDPAHFRNRFFKTQFLRAEDCYRSQIEKCDIVIETTAAAIWVTPEISEILLDTF